MIGLSGWTGFAWYPHLHFGLYRSRQGAVDPFPFLNPPRGSLAEQSADLDQLGEWVRLVNDGIRLRAEPGRSGAVLRELGQHTPLRVLGGSGAYFRVRSPEGIDGYVAARLTEPVDSPLRSQVAAAGGAVLLEPKDDAQVMVWLEPGEEVPVLGLGYLALSAWLLAKDARWRLRSAWSLAALFVLLGSVVLRPHAGMSGQTRLVERWETPYGWIDVVDDTRSGARLMRQNVHYLHASTAEAWRQRRQAHVPLLLHPRPRKVLFLGLSTGITAGAALMHPEVEQLEVAELIPEVAEAARHFASYNGGVLDDARATVHLNDARHHLRATPERFDVIVSDLFVPWMSHAGYLYTVEHFRVAREKLASGGLFCLWIAPWQVGRRELEIIADSFASVFPRVSLWRTSARRRDLLALVGSETPIRLAGARLESRLARLRSRQEQDDAVLPSARDFADLYGGDWIVRRPDRLNSDEHPLIEFLAPVAQLERNRLGPGRLGRFYDEVLMEMPTRNFVYKPLPGARPWDPSGGRRRQRQWLADRERR